MFLELLNKTKIIDTLWNTFYKKSVHSKCQWIVDAKTARAV